MYHAAVRRIARRTYGALSRGDFQTVVAGFDSEAVLFFSGDHVLAGTFRGREAIFAWFKRLYACFPDLRLHPETIVVEGFPWDTRVATRFRVTATLSSGRPYANEGMQLLRIRWGRVVEDRLYEDTKALNDALSELAQAGVPAARSGSQDR